MFEYKLVYYKKSITNLFGEGEGIVEKFDNINEIYERYNVLKNGKKRYLIEIYKNDNKISEDKLMKEWSEEIKRPYIENKTFKKELVEDGDNPEKIFGRVYSDDLVFGIYITKDFHIGLHDVNTVKLLHLLDTNQKFNMAFRMLTGIIENKTPFESASVLGDAIEGIFQPLISDNISVLIVPYELI